MLKLHWLLPFGPQPPPPDGDAPPSYESIDHIPNHFHNPRFEAGEEEPPPPYSPGPGLSQHGENEGTGMCELVCVLCVCVNEYRKPLILRFYTVMTF